jgi:hypothetical protein
MDQKPTVLYLRMKGMALDAIHDNPVRALGKDAVAYSTVTKYTLGAQFSGRTEATSPEAPDVEHSPVDEAILTAPAAFLFRLCVSFRRGSLFRDPPCTGTGTSRNHFVPGCDIFDGSQLLTAEQEQIRIQMAIELLQILSVQSTRQRHDIITLDESWVYLFSEHDLMWTAP